MCVDKVNHFPYITQTLASRSNSGKQKVKPIYCTDPRASFSYMLFLRGLQEWSVEREEHVELFNVKSDLHKEIPCALENDSGCNLNSHSMTCFSSDKLAFQAQ